MLSFLRPTFESLSKLEESVEMHSQERGTFILKGALIACTCDLPARAMVTNFIQYNGRYCCPKCLQEENVWTSERGGHILTFPFMRDDPGGAKRYRAEYQRLCC